MFIFSPTRTLSPGWKTRLTDEKMKQEEVLLDIVEEEMAAEGSTRKKRTSKKFALRLTVRIDREVVENYTYDIP